MMLSRALPSLSVAFGLVLGCKAGDPVDHPTGDEDAAPEAPIEPPELDSVPTRTPLSTVAVRGTTEGTRIVTQGSPAGTVVTVVLPGGSFCADAMLDTTESGTKTELRMYAMTGDGRISEPTGAEVIYDTGVAPPSSPSCTGMTDECDEVELCRADNVDEDCNGWADQCDLVCSDCDDDIYEPNDLPINVPSLQSGTYNLKLCPCRDDWFAFEAGPGDRVHATVTFVHSQIDIDAKLHLSGPDGQGAVTPAVSTAATTANTEEIDYTVPTDQPGGTYFLRIYPYQEEEKPSGTYSITVN